MPESFQTSQTETRPDGTTIETTLRITLSDDPAPYDGEAEGDFETPEVRHVQTFLYDGAVREIANAQFVKGAYVRRGGTYQFNALIEGTELTRDGVETNQFKKFSLDKLIPVLPGS